MKRKWIKYGINIGLVVGFILFITIPKSHNISTYLQLRRKSRTLQENISKAKNQISNKYTYEQLKNNDKLLEKYAREQLNMQKKEEDVFVIVYE